MLMLHAQIAQPIYCKLSPQIFIMFFCITATTTECDLCNKNGKCILDDVSNVRCECRPWFAGRNCQINLKLLLIVGCVSVILMIVIACGVSCFCCRDRHAAKNSIPCKYKDFEGSLHILTRLLFIQS